MLPVDALSIDMSLVVHRIADVLYFGRESCRGHGAKQCIAGHSTLPSYMCRCSPEVYGLAHALSQQLLEATAGLRTQLAAAAVVASQPQSPLLRAAMLSSIPEGGLPLDDPDEDAISESPSLVSLRSALLFCQLNCICGHSARCLCHGTCFRKTAWFAACYSMELVAFAGRAPGAAGGADR